MSLELVKVGCWRRSSRLAWSLSL